MHWINSTDIITVCDDLESHEMLSQVKICSDVERINLNTISISLHEQKSIFFLLLFSYVDKPTILSVRIKYTYVLSVIHHYEPMPTRSRFDIIRSTEFNLISWFIEFLMKEWQEKSIFHKKKDREKNPNPPEAIILEKIKRILNYVICTSTHS